MKKVIDIEDRIPTLRERRRKRTNKKFIILSVLFFIILLVLVYSQSPYSDVKKLEITGASLVDKGYYSDKSKIAIGESMWSFSENEIEQRLEKDDWVKKVKVERKLLTTVNVEIEEWKKVAFTNEEGTFYPVLENGSVYSEASRDGRLDAPVFMQFEDKNVRKRLVKELAKLNPEVLALISQINAAPTDSDPNTIRLYMNDGFEVRAIISTLVSKLNYYPSIVAQIPDGEKGIIDLEVGSYYRPYDEEYSGVGLGIEQSESQGEVVDVEQDVVEDAETTGQ